MLKDLQGVGRAATQLAEGVQAVCQPPVLGNRERDSET